MDLSRFKTDQKRCVEGVWVALDEETEIKIARYNNPQFRELMQKKLAPYKTLVRANRLGEDLAEKIMVEAYVETILLDWKNLLVDGQKVPYSKETAKKILQDSKYSDFRELVVQLSQDMELFRSEEVEETVKKFPNTSSGASSGVAT